MLSKRLTFSHQAIVMHTEAVSVLQTVAWNQCTRYLEQFVLPALLSAMRIVQSHVQKTRIWTIINCMYFQTVTSVIK